MGYTPKCRYLKKDAVPTIFKDSKPPKKRVASERRQEKKNRKQVKYLHYNFFLSIWTI